MRMIVRGCFCGVMLVVLPLIALIAWSQDEPHAWRWAWRETVLPTWTGGP